MTSTVWDRDLAADVLRPYLWRYLSGSARIVRELTTSAADLQLDRSELVRIFSTHLALEQSTQNALAVAQMLLNELPSSAALARVELQGQVRGQVDWARTQERRIASADPTLFVCSPPERRYDTPLGRLLHVALRCISELAGLSTLPPTGPVGAVVHETSDRARRLLLHPKLSKVRRVDYRSVRHTEELVGRRPDTASLVDLVQKYVAGIVEGGEDELRATLERQFLAPDDDSRLFELQIGFELLEALEDCGFVPVPPMPLLPGSKAPFAVVRSEAGDGFVYWQRPVWVLAPTLSETGAWATVLRDNSLPQQPLRPDFVVDLPGVHRRFLVEAKLTTRSAGSPDREGIRDALAYLFDAGAVFNHSLTPHAMVVAWNSTALPMVAQGAVRVANQHNWKDLVRSVLVASNA